MLFPKSSCVYIPCIKSIAPRICMAKIPFLAFLGPDMSTEMGVVIYMYFNIPQIILIPNIYGFIV